MAFEYVTGTGLDHIRALIQPGLLNESTEPTDVQAETWVTNDEARIDVARVQGGLTTPATNANVKAALDQLVSQHVAWIVQFTRGVWKKDHPFYEEFQAALEALAAGNEVEVVGALGGPPSSYNKDGPSTTDATVNAKVSFETQF